MIELVTFYCDWYDEILYLFRIKRNLKFKGFLSLFALLQLLHTYVIKLEYTVKKYPAFPLDLELGLGLKFVI